MFQSLEAPRHHQGLMLSQRSLFSNSKKSLPVLKPGLSNLLTNSRHNASVETFNLSQHSISGYDQKLQGAASVSNLLAQNSVSSSSRNLKPVPEKFEYSLKDQQHIFKKLPKLRGSTSNKHSRTNSDRLNKIIVPSFDPEMPLERDAENVQNFQYSYKSIANSIRMRRIG